MKQIKTYIILFLILSSIIQFFYWEQKIKKINSENEKLKIELDSARINSNRTYNVLLSPDNTELTIGETYKTSIFLTQDYSNKIKYIAIDVNKDIFKDNLRDTVAYNNDYKTYLYSYKTMKLGTNKIVGKVIYVNSENKEDSIYFMQNIEVTN